MRSRMSLLIVAVVGLLAGMTVPTAIGQQPEEPTLDREATRLDAIEAALGDLRREFGTMRLGLELGVDEQLCINHEGEVELGLETSSDLYFRFVADAGIFVYGTGASAKPELDSKAEFKLGSAGGSEIEYSKCFSLGPADQTTAQRMERLTPRDAEFLESLLAAAQSLNIPLDDNGQIDLDRMQQILDLVASLSLQGVPTLNDMKQQLATWSEALPLPAGIRDKLADLDGSLAELVDQLRNAIRICENAPDVPEVVLDFIDDICAKVDLVPTIEDVAAFIDGFHQIKGDIVESVNALCVGVNDTLADLNGLTISSPGTTQDLGRWTVVTGVNFRNRTITRTTIGPGVRTFGAFSMQPFRNFPTSICSELAL